MEVVVPPLPMVLHQVRGLLAPVESLEQGTVAVLVAVKLAGILEWLVAQEVRVVRLEAVVVLVAQATMGTVVQVVQGQQAR
jgi:hypothetical protein